MTPLYILQCNAVTGVGLCAASSAAAVRSAISTFTEHPKALDFYGDPAIVASPPDHLGTEDAAATITDLAVEALEPLAEGEPLPVFLALPEPRPGLPEDLAESVARTVQERVPGARVARPRGFGHAAGGLALQQASDFLTARDNPVAAVVGADCYLPTRTIEWLDDERQLHASYNAWGFIPGAGAGACLVCQRETLRTRKDRPIALVEGIALAKEAAPIKTEEVCLGRAVSDIIEKLTEGDPDESPVFDSFYNDMNGEAYRADELGFALSRTSGRFLDPAGFIAPADCWGDVGAASIPLFIALACEAAAWDTAPGPVSLHMAGSEGGLRAGVRLRTPEPDV